MLQFRRVRLTSGVVMFAFLTTHLLNHDLGVVSITLAESALRIATAFWRTPVATVLLYGAAALHVAMAYWTLYSRRHWQIPLLEIVRLAAGFSFPMLLIGHVTTTRLGSAFFHVDPTYLSIIGRLQTAGSEGMQMALLAPGWLHGCLGLWISLRRFALMQRLKPILLVLVVLVPLFAALGFLRMSGDISAAASHLPSNGDTPIAQLTLATWRTRMTWGYVLSILAALLIGKLRSAHQLSP